MTEVKVQLKYVRLSPRKTRLAVDVIRGLSVAAAEVQLQQRHLKAAPIILKLIKSAVATATNDFKLAADNLLIKSISVDGGPVLKRYRARAFGRAASIRKPTSHINLVLGEIKPTDKNKTKSEDKSTSKAKGISKAVEASAGDKATKVSQDWKDKKNKVQAKPTTMKASGKSKRVAEKKVSGKNK